MIKKYNLNNRVALITGASGHIGSEISSELREFGATVILIDLDGKKLATVHKKLIKKFKNKISSYSMDLTEKTSREDLFRSIKNKHGRVDIIVNALGIVGTNETKGWNTDFKNQSMEAWNKCMDTNLTSVFFLIQKLHTLMLKSKNASIINISSIYGDHAPDKDLYKGTSINNPAAYSISKAGLNYMTKWLSSTLAPKIRVNTISPGGILRKQDAKFVKKYTERTLLDRMGSEKDLRGPVLFLASDMSSYITGQNIIVDGGWTIK